ncbi:MAG: hypothetical protein IJ927_03515 [Eubacterium sp.]|nr:hypothetical protein [Eubacterium sp.]MBR4241801.1 hypothetical protein [Eubacterium sp.]
MALININYREVIRKAEELESLAAELNRTCEGLQNLMSISYSNWTGDTANQYTNKIKGLYVKTKSQANSLSQTAGALRRKAEFYNMIESSFGGKR